MSLKIKERNQNQYLYFQRKDGTTVFLGKIGEISKYPDRVAEALDVLLGKDSGYFEYEKKLLSILPPSKQKDYIPKIIKKIETEEKDLYSLSPSVTKQYKEKTQKITESETRRRNEKLILKIENICKKLSLRKRVYEVALDIISVFPEIISKSRPLDVLSCAIVYLSCKQADQVISLTEICRVNYPYEDIKSITKKVMRIYQKLVLQEPESKSTKKITVYGLSTEGYALACKMAVKGADVSIIDESVPSAISLKPELAKTYSEFSTLMKDEPLLAMHPVDQAISNANYIFFVPRIRETDQKIKTDIHSKLENFLSLIRKGCSIIYSLPTGIGGNQEIISTVEDITKFRVDREIQYYYYPISFVDKKTEFIGSIKAKPDIRLATLLSEIDEEIKFVSIDEAENIHMKRTFQYYSTVIKNLEQTRFTKTKKDFSEEKFVFLDDLVKGYFDLNLLLKSKPEENPVIEHFISSLNRYIQLLLDEITSDIKSHKLDPEKTRVALLWTMDQYEMRGSKINMLQYLSTAILDQIHDVELLKEGIKTMPASDKTTILVACSRKDFELVKKLETPEISKPEIIVLKK